MVMNTYNPIKTYPYSPNRLMVIDWASLSYHQMHSIKSEKRTTVLNIESAEDEIRMWNNHMLSKVLKYIKLFNPKDIICALEGKNVWRFDYVRDCVFIFNSFILSKVVIVKSGFSFFKSVEITSLISLLSF